MIAENQTHLPGQKQQTELPVEEINKCINEIEEKYDLLQYKVDGWCVWPRFRFLVGRAMGGDSHLTTSKMMSLSWIGSLILEVLRDTRRLHKIRPARYLINNFSSALTEQEGNLYKDIFFDDLLREIGNHFKFEIVNTPQFSARRKSALIKSHLTTTSFRLVATVLARLSGPQYIRDIARQLSACLQSELGLTTFTPRWIEVRLREFYWLKKVYGWLLRQLRPEYLLKANIAGRELVAAAKEQGITVVEFQHGYTDRYHYEYSWSAQAVKYKPHMPIPDYLFLYGDHTKQELNTNGFWGEALRVVGNVRVDQYRRQKLKIKKQDNCCTLLFTTQGIEVERSISFLTDFLQATKKQLDLRMIIKLHPIWDRNKAPYEAAFQADQRVQVLLGSEPPSTFQLLLQAHIHLSISSSCHYDALAFSIPTVIMPFTTHDLVLPLYEAGHAFLAHTPGELLDIALQWKNLKVPDFVGEYYFKPGALENIKKELGFEPQRNQQR